MKKLWLLSMVTFGCDATTEVPGAADSCADSCAEGQSCHEGVCLGAVRWLQALPVNQQGEAAVDLDGQIFVTSARAQDGVLVPWVHAFDASGTSRWYQELPGASALGYPSRPTIGPNGDIYIASGISLVALTPRGRVRWSVDAPRQDDRFKINLALPAPAPAINSEGHILWQFMAATDTMGRTRWTQRIDPETRCESAIPIRRDRALFRGGNQIFALNNFGEVIWNVEAPLGLQGEGSCATIPVNERLVATLWCKQSSDPARCGHVVLIDIESGQIQSYLPPVKPVYEAANVLVNTAGHLVFFSQSNPANPADFARMWTQNLAGELMSAPLSLPWRSIYGASLGDDGVYYLATDLGLAAVDAQANVLWSYSPPMPAGSFSGAPTIGSDGCVHYESVHGEWGQYQREMVCLESTARGLAATPWPRSLGGNRSAMNPD